MIWLTIGLAVLGALPKILTIVEKMFDNIPDSSADKKKMAKGMVSAVILGATDVTGPELDKILIAIDKMVELI